MNERSRNRQSNFELMRIISMVFIVICHLVTRTTLLLNCTPSLFLAIRFIQLFITVHVNSFILITGYFQYKKQPSQKKAISLLGTSWFYRILFVILFTGLNIVQLTKREIYEEVYPLDITDYWFINAYFALIFLAPFINKLIEKLTQQEHRKLILISLLLFSIIPNISYQMTIQNNGFTVIQFVMIYIIGAYFGKYPLKDNLHFKNYSKPKTQLILITMMMLSFFFNFLIYVFGQYIATMNNPIWQELANIIGQSFNYSNILIIIQSVSYFLFFETLQIKSKIIDKLASLTVGVYFVHDNVIVREWLYKIFKLNTDKIVSKKIFLTIFVATIIIYFASSLIEWIRQLLGLGGKKLWMKIKSSKKQKQLA